MTGLILIDSKEPPKALIADFQMKRAPRMCHIRNHTVIQLDTRAATMSPSWILAMMSMRLVSHVVRFVRHGFRLLWNVSQSMERYLGCPGEQEVEYRRCPRKYQHFYF